MFDSGKNNKYSLFQIIRDDEILRLTKSSDAHFFKLKPDSNINSDEGDMTYNNLLYNHGEWDSSVINFYQKTAPNLLGGKRQRKTKRRKQNRRTIKRRRRQ